MNYFPLTRNLVRKARKRCQQSQEDFAITIAVKVKSIGDWEAGRKRPHPDRLRKIAKLVPGLAAEIESVLATYEWHPTKGQGANEEKKLQPIVDLDVILERADCQTQEEVAEYLHKKAGNWSRVHRGSEEKRPRSARKSIDTPGN